MNKLHLQTGPVLILLCLLLIPLGNLNGQVIWDRAQIDLARDGDHAADSPIGIAKEKLRAFADAALERGPYSVMDKEIVPPTGDKHDYLSYSRYWWPDPDKPDGLPYIRKDGVVNRELLAKGDRNRLGEFRDDVRTLGLAGYVLKEPRYTKHAADLVRTWFLNEDTYMKPNVQFGQGVPGRAAGRGPGVIDTRGFMLLLDVVELFDEQHWSAEDHTKLQKWFDDYQQWLSTHPLGLHEQKAKNNHGSWYAAQRSRYALFAGKEDLAREIVQQVQERIAKQFASNGDQAEELKRTQSLKYSLFNITALSRVARVGDQLGENLWEFEPEGGCGLRRALDGLLPYLKGEQKWEHPQIIEVTLSPSSHATLRMFSRQFNDEKYRKLTDVMPMKYPELDFACIVIGEEKVPATVEQ